MSDKKSLGQIAFEAATAEAVAGGFHLSKWESQIPPTQHMWEAAAKAVEHEVTYRVHKHLAECILSYHEANAELTQWEELFDLFPECQEIADVVAAVKEQYFALVEIGNVIGTGECKDLTCESCKIELQLIRKLAAVRRKD